MSQSPREQSIMYLQEPHKLRDCDRIMCDETEDPCNAGHVVVVVQAIDSTA